jgi:hypothetical protein
MGFVDWGGHVKGAEGAKPRDRKLWLNGQNNAILFIDFYISREATHRFRTSNNAKSNPEIKGRNSIFFRHDVLQVSGHALFTSSPHVFLLNIFINKTERRIHFYWIHFLDKIVTWLTREYVYLWYRLLEINVGTRDTAADEML